MSDSRTAGCWRSRPEAQPLRAWKRSQLDAFAAVLAAGWVGWADAWGLRAPGANVACEAAFQGAAMQSDWTWLGGARGGGAWITAPASIERTIAHALFDVDGASTPVACAVVQACRADLLARTAAALRIEPAALPNMRPQCGAWSGSVLARGLGDVQVLASAAVLRPLIDAGGPEPRAGVGVQRESVVPMVQALAQRQLPLQVLLAGCEIEVGTLRALRPGDVLPTEHALSLPAEVRTAGGERLFSAHLVRNGGLRAIELAEVKP